MKNSDSIVLGGGCFWCLDAIYRLQPGVVDVTSGYAGGHLTNPSYEQVCSGETGHAEVVKVTFDPEVTSLEKMLDLFWKAHDPTTLNRQGPDIGPQYRSIILFRDEVQRKKVEESINKHAVPIWGDNITTEVTQLQKFCPAENYHQDYYNKNPNAGYCRAVIAPKLKKI